MLRALFYAPAASRAPARRARVDYKRELLVAGGAAANHLRTYRREVFDVIGYFNEAIRYGEDYEMALRILDRYEITLVPEVLYGLRVHEHRITQRMGFTTGLHFLVNRLAICRQLRRDNRVAFLNDGRYNLNRLMLASVSRTLRHAWLRGISTIWDKIRAPRS
jgi:hypothetical protein